MLNDEQRKTLEQSLWVVNTVIKELGLQLDDDMRSQASLYMCKCIERYDPKFGVKWSTYAYKSLYLYIKTRHAKEMVKKAPIVPIESCFNLATEMDDNIYNKLFIETLQTILTPLENEILTRKFKEQTAATIRKELNLTKKQFDEAWHSIKDKAGALIPPH